MANFANMTLNDGTGTPVARTFTAVWNQGLQSKWQYIPSGAVPLAARTAVMKFTPAAKQDGRHKVDLHIVVPLVDAPASAGGAYTPQPRVVGSCEYRVLSWNEARASDQDRADALAFTIAALSNTQISDALKQGIPPV